MPAKSPYWATEKSPENSTAQTRAIFDGIIYLVGLLASLILTSLTVVLTAIHFQPSAVQIPCDAFAYICIGKHM
jgi:hypothetical protein